MSNEVSYFKIHRDKSIRARSDSRKQSGIPSFDFFKNYRVSKETLEAARTSKSDETYLSLDKFVVLFPSNFTVILPKDIFVDQVLLFPIRSDFYTTPC